MHYKLNTQQLHQVQTMNNLWIAEYRLRNPNDHITQRYAQTQEVGEYHYLLKDSVTEQYITEYINIVDAIPSSDKADWHEQTTMRVILSHKDNTQLMKSEYGITMLQYIQENEIVSHEDDKYVYTYVNFLLDEHRSILEQFNGFVEP